MSPSTVRHLPPIPSRFRVTRNYGRLRMRIRSQEGWVEERDESVGYRGKRWYGHYYTYVRDAAGKEVRRHVGIALGDKAKLPKCAAKAKLRKFIAAASAIEEQLRKVITERSLNAEDLAA